MCGRFPPPEGNRDISHNVSPSRYPPRGSFAIYITDIFEKTGFPGQAWSSADSPLSQRCCCAVPSRHRLSRMSRRTGHRASRLSRPATMNPPCSISNSLATPARTASPCTTTSPYASSSCHASTKPGRPSATSPPTTRKCAASRNTTSGSSNAGSATMPPQDSTSSPPGTTAPMTTRFDRWQPRCSRSCRRRSRPSGTGPSPCGPVTMTTLHFATVSDFRPASRRKARWRICSPRWASTRPDSANSGSTAASTRYVHRRR